MLGEAYKGQAVKQSCLGYDPQERMSPVAYIPSVSGTLGDTGVYRHTTEPIFIRDRILCLDLETGLTYKHTRTHIYTLTSE